MPPTKSPGPANFTLKPLVGYRDHDFNSSKVRRPQWTMGKSLPMNFEYKSPGPATVNIENFTRYGKHTSPTHPMYGKSKGLKADPNPGPTHNPVQVCLYKGRCNPKYSVRRQTKPLTADPNPGPGCEATPANVYKHRSPKFPMAQRTKELTPDKGPGPNVYDISEPKKRTIHRNPEFSHRWKTIDPLEEKDKKPGPANYDLMKYNPFERSPTYSMGRKHCEYNFVPIIPMDNC